jgi:hypothetical protein
LLIKHLLTPILVGIPPSSKRLLNERSVSGILSLVLENFYNLLSSSWRAESDDPEQEALLNLATSSLFGMIYDIMCPAAERDKKIDPNLSLAALRSRTYETTSLPSLPISIYLTEHSTPTNFILRILISMLQWNASAYAAKIILILSKWVPVLLNLGPMHHEILFSLWSPILQLSIDPKLSELSASAIGLLTELYKWQLYFNYTCYDQCLRDYFLLEDAVVSMKSQRSMVRNRLVRPVLEAASGITSVVPRLPDRVIYYRKMKNADIIDLNVENLFD